MDIPAIEGGKRTRESYLPYGRHYITNDDVESVVNVLRGEWLTTGPEVPTFERELSEYISSSYVRAVSSGTSALICGVGACGIGEGDEVITTPLSFAGTTNAILFWRARPVFADIDIDTLNIDPCEIERKINPKTKGVLILHYGGHPASMDEINEICERKKLNLIEDCAHALGATYKGKMAGTFGDAGCFSTHPVKHIATGEGGFITLREGEKARWVSLFRNQGIDTETLERHASTSVHRYEITELGYNFRMSDIQAVLGRSQLRRHSENLKMRRFLAGLYDEKLKSISGVSIPKREDYIEDAYHLYPIMVNLEMLKVDRDHVIRALRAEGIGATLHYPAIHTLAWHGKNLGYSYGDMPKCEMACERLITLPLFPQMIEEDIEDVITALKKILIYYQR
ncbi:MAG: DegT/DnrJ/EryC1/StrS family aminotransferase [bacterium]